MQHRLGRRTPHSAALLAPLWAAAAAAAAATLAQAGPLADPTRPPAGMAALQPHATGANGSVNATAAIATPAQRSAAASAPAAAAPAPLQQPVLQSVQLPVRGPAVALVDGQLVKAGDMVGKRMVLIIDSQGLVLRGDAGTERLWLLAGNSKQAPGSIVTTHSVSFVPAPRAPDPAQEIDARNRPERTGAGPLQPNPGAGLSLAGRTQP